MASEGAGGSPGPLPDRIRDATFPLAYIGYRVDEVDRWLEHTRALASEAAAGLPVELPAQPTFPRGLGGYDRRAVDEFVRTVIAELARP